MHNRSKVDPFQLILLCPDKYVNTKSINYVMRPLVDDVKILESSGIDLGFEQLIRGSILCILGDNLGSHLIGGFATNFSTMKYMCRYYNITRDEFLNNCLGKKSYRTPFDYNIAVQNLASQDVYMGIKQSSIFNELQFFHVCDPGLPACLAHDIFEGVTQCDMMLHLNF